MKVKELIIDGFKSYATRTVISDWDKTFNCITGLNGSGKSNILDAICFVLGITSMTTVRAQNLQDLIYKRGQAGVTKASVTIVFDNTDKHSSPLGFEDQPNISVTRQVVMGGTSKYLVNGHRAQQQTVQQLFQSVQLNINNPNFLIMQGRITKVLNMKATEILALIEEAAGTRMFEERREKAIKTMAKKEKKVEEIMSLLNEEIEPKLEALRTEKREFLEYQQIQTDLERAEKVIYSHDYINFTQKLEAILQELESSRDHQLSLEKLVEKSTTEIKSLTEDIAASKTLKENQIKKDGKFQALEKKVKDLSHESVRIITLRDLKSSSIVEEENKLMSISSNAHTLGEAVENKKAELEIFQQKFEASHKDLESLSHEKDLKEELLQSLQTGISSRAGVESGYANELKRVKEKISEASITAKQARIHLESLQLQQNQDTPKLKEANSQRQHALSELKLLESQYDSLQKSLGDNSSSKLDGLKEKEKALIDELRELTRQIENSKKTVSSIEFTYTKPSASFDPKSVKGVVAQLFSLKETKFNAANALEVCAGGRLYQVVVDTDVTGSELLLNGRLRRRVTIIPLNKINTFRISSQKLGAAQQLAPNKVNLALNLIGYEDEVQKAMEYVFGNTFICEDADSAKKVAFDPSVRIKTVTLDGDIYDPLGTLSGGSNSNSNGLLTRLQKLNILVTKKNSIEEELINIKKKIGVESKLLDRFRALKKEFELKEHELNISRKQFESATFTKFLISYDERKEKILELGKTIVESLKIETEGREEIKKIEKDMGEFNHDKSGKLRELEVLLTIRCLNYSDIELTFFY